MCRKLFTIAGCLALILQTFLLTVAAPGSPPLARDIGPGAAAQSPPLDLSPYASAAARGGSESGPASVRPEKIPWNIETVESPNDVGQYTSLALDTAGHAHISYYDATNRDLRYAHYVSSGGNCGGGAWQCESVDSTDDVGQYTSVALDTAGRPHISYYDATSGDLKYAYYNGSSWTIMVADSTGIVGLYTSLALDGSNQAHISYYDGTVTNGDLKYAHYVGSGGNCGGGAWQCEFVETAGLEGFYTSLALDSSGQPHISYFGQNSLKYAHRVGSGGNCGGGAWQCDPVVGTGNSGGYTSLALDGADRPGISFYNGTSGDLRYAQYVGTGGNCGAGGWQCDTVDSANDVGQYTSLALNTAGQPRISYYDVTNRDLRYACYISSGGNCGGGAWQCETVDSAGGVGLYTSLALDALGRPHISYYDTANFDLKHAFSDCTPVVAVDVSGPDFVLVGETNTYTATYSPPIATLPVTITWDNGAVGPTAAYSWMLPGTYTITVTATNSCGVAHGTFVVTACQPLTGADISGPGSLLVGETGTYTATFLPPTATQPVTLTWDNGAAGLTTTYSWMMSGTYTITVTATNRCSQVSATLAVAVQFPCYPMTGGQVNGPTYLLPGATGMYTATYFPPTATLPVTPTWDNGTVGPTSAYSWTLPNTYSVTVTSTNPCSQVTATLAVLVATSCDPVTGAEAYGPAVLFTGETGVYTATSSPPTASPLVTFAWDNGTAGPTAAYSWTVPGSYAATVTATNPCGQVSATLPVTVLCSPLTGVGIDGQASLPTGETGVYTATYSPPTATLPVTLTWDNGMVGPTATYSWTLPGTHTITVTATNLCREISATLAVLVMCSPVYGADFTWAPPTPMVGEQVTFTGTATSSLSIIYTWDLSTITATGPVVVRTYMASGSYPVTMTASNGCAEDVAAHTVTVEPLPPQPIYLPFVYRNWNPCYLAGGSFWEHEPNDSIGEANGPLCSGQVYDARPSDTDDFFYFSSGPGGIAVTMGSYAPAPHGELVLYSNTGKESHDNNPWDGWQIITDTAVVTEYWIRVYTDPAYTTTTPYTVSATFPEP